jgi:hypothetical protein
VFNMRAHLLYLAFSPAAFAFSLDFQIPFASSYSLACSMGEHNMTVKTYTLPKLPYAYDVS